MNQDDKNAWTIKQGLFQLFWEKAPGLNWKNYAAFWEFLQCKLLNNIYYCATFRTMNTDDISV